MTSESNEREQLEIARQEISDLKRKLRMIRAKLKKIPNEITLKKIHTLIEDAFEMDALDGGYNQIVKGVSFPPRQPLLLPQIQTSTVSIQTDVCMVESVEVQTDTIDDEAKLKEKLIDHIDDMIMGLRNCREELQCDCEEQSLEHKSIFASPNRKRIKREHSHTESLPRMPILSPSPSFTELKDKTVLDDGTPDRDEIECCRAEETRLSSPPSDKPTPSPVSYLFEDVERTCVVCEKTFTTYRDFFKHYCRPGKTTPPWPCCGKEYKHLGYYERHRLSKHHRGVKPPEMTRLDKE